MHRPHPPVYHTGRNWEALFKAVLLFAFAAGIGTLVLNGKISLYIHPRFVPFTLVAGLMLILMGLVQFLRFLAPTAEASPGPSGGIAVFLIPLILGLALPPATFGADLAAKQGVNLTERGRGPAPATGLTAPPAPPEPAEPAASPEPTPTAPTAPPAPARPSEPAGDDPDSEAVATRPAPPAAATGQTPPADSPGASQPLPPGESEPGTGGESEATPDPAAPGTRPLPLIDGRVVLTDQTFAPWLLEIYDHPQVYVGKPVEVTGFVFRPEGLGPGEFVLARLIVTCHVAHAVPDGFLVLWPEAGQLQDDTWYRVKGTFGMSQYLGEEIISIQAEELTPVEKPRDPYIYG